MVSKLEDIGNNSPKPLFRAATTCRALRKQRERLPPRSRRAAYDADAGPRLQTFEEISPERAALAERIARDSTNSRLHHPRLAEFDRTVRTMRRARRNLPSGPRYPELVANCGNTRTSVTGHDLSQNDDANMRCDAAPQRLQITWKPDRAFEDCWSAARGQLRATSNATQTGPTWTDGRIRRHGGRLKARLMRARVPASTIDRVGS